MSDLLKKSSAYAFAIISAVFTFVPEAVFGTVSLIPEAVLKQFKWIEDNISEISIIVNRILAFMLVWAITALGYKVYLHWRNKIKIKGNNYKIIVEYGDLFKTKNVKE